MKKLRRPIRLSLLIAVVSILALALPAPLAAAEEPAGSSGWVPQEPESEADSEAAAPPVRYGSSLGSGGGSGGGGSSRSEGSGSTESSGVAAPAPEPVVEEPAVTATEETPAAGSEAASEAEAPVVAAPPASPSRPARTDPGDATELASSQRSAPAPAASVAATPAPAPERVSSGSRGAVLAVLAILLGLALFYVGWFAVVPAWRRRRKRRQLVELWQQEDVEWETAIYRAQREQAPEASSQKAPS